jgi:predicted phage terminase large subunit-like protein
MNVSVPLSTKQIQFMRSSCKGIIYRGGIRSGKSYIACYKAIINAFKGRRQLMISFSYRTLKDVILFTLKECFRNLGMIEGRDFVINLSDMIVKIGKTEILLRSGDSPDSIRGLSVHDVYIDEAREFSDNSIFLIAIGRMSESSDGQWHITSSPKGKDWTWQLCEDQGSNVELIVQKTSENPFLPEGYEDELRRNYSTLFAAQELEADIVELGAGVINPNWFRLIDTSVPIKGVRAWDTAVTVKESSDYSAGALCDIYNNRFRILDMIRDKFLYPDLKKKIIETALLDGPYVIIGLESVGQSKAFVDDLQRVPELRGHTIKSFTPQGDKLNRALPWVTRAENGLVDVCRGSWNANFYNECSSFSADMSHLHDDQIDCVSTAWALLSRPRTTTAHKKLY